MTSATSAGEAAARSAGVGQRRKSSGVTRFTCASVVCAERSTAMTRWKGLSWLRKHSTGPYNASRRRHTSTARADFAALVSLGILLLPGAKSGARPRRTLAQNVADRSNDILDGAEDPSKGTAHDP